MKRSGPSKLDAWRKSPEWRAIARAHCLELQRRRALLPKCGAARKRDGEPCQQTAMSNGRCHIHGGRTPKGDDWHRPIWPKGRPRAVEKMRAKLHDLEQARKKREARLAGMTQEERDAHRRWQTTHKPGPVGQRKRARAERKANADARASFALSQARELRAEAAAECDHADYLIPSNHELTAFD